MIECFHSRIHCTGWRPYIFITSNENTPACDVILVAWQHISNVISRSFPLFTLLQEQRQLMRCLAINIMSHARVFSCSVLKKILELFHSPAFTWWLESNETHRNAVLPHKKNHPVTKHEKPQSIGTLGGTQICVTLNARDNDITLPPCLPNFRTTPPALSPDSPPPHISLGVLNVAFAVHACGSYSSTLILHSLCIIKHRNVLLNGFSFSGNISPSGGDPHRGSAPGPRSPLETSVLETPRLSPTPQLSNPRKHPAI